MNELGAPCPAGEAKLSSAQAQCLSITKEIAQC